MARRHLNVQGQVAQMVLDRNNLCGSMPAALGKLDSLTRLAPDSNGLTGDIPSQLGSLPDLSIIGLARNSLSGALPSTLSNLSGLPRLSLHDNTGVSGPLPSGFTAWRTCNDWPSPTPASAPRTPRRSGIGWTRCPINREECKPVSKPLRTGDGCASRQRQSRQM